MNRSILTLVLIFLTFANTIAQDNQHIYNHTFPTVNYANPKIQDMIEEMNVEDLKADVEHLCSYINRRADGPYIYEVKDWLVEKFISLGIDSIYLHDFEPFPYWDTVPRPFRTAPNLLAIQPGISKPNEIVMCGGHYDSTVNTDGEFDIDTLRAPGADDNASGTAGIIATARILSKYNFERTIIYACWNAEEFGLCGSSEFAKQCAADSIDIVAYTNLDMTAYLEPGNDMVVNLLYKNCDSLLGTFMKQVVRNYYPGINVYQAWLPQGDTDFSSFNRNGYQSISLSEEVHHLSPFIHSTSDIVGVSINNYEQAMVFNGITLAAVAELAGLTDNSIDEIVKDNLQLYPNPGSNIIHVYGDYLNFEVFDLIGNKILSLSNESEFDVNNWQKGVYVVRLTTSESKLVCKKLVVK